MARFDRVTRLDVLTAVGVVALLVKPGFAGVVAFLVSLVAVVVAQWLGEVRRVTVESAAMLETARNTLARAEEFSARMSVIENRLNVRR